MDISLILRIIIIIVSVGLIVWRRKLIWIHRDVIISLILAIATIYGANQLLPGDSAPLKPSAYGIILGPENFPSHHIVVPIEWRNNGGQPSLVRQPKLILHFKGNNSFKGNGTPVITFPLAGELREDYFDKLDQPYLNKTFIKPYSLNQAFIIEPHSIKRTVLVFHIQNWWNSSTGKNAYNFTFIPKDKYSVNINYSYISFLDILGIKSSSGEIELPLFDIEIFDTVKDMNRKNYTWDSFQVELGDERDSKNWLWPF